MTVAQFEQAIDAKGAHILEIRLHQNQVKNAIGRKDNKVILWDDQGYAFSAIMPDGIDDEEALEKMNRYHYDPDPELNLEF
ncbi:MAG: hypothetical protein IJK08_05765 [Prevotella sp.]|nr:hypothetical protein [Prevotella sp.]